MKKFVCGMLVVILLVGSAGIAGRIEHNYTREDCEIVEVHGTTVVAEDKAGYLWEFDGEGYTVGAHVDLKMHTNFTHDTMFDDVITDVR